ncbi:Zinc finger, PHD-type domain-containing protein [Rozella allomycis CSF55]|uniref:Zinc finger, PHD-type domain-containing protein n=1 Tax=Rozella allomycis (strain CSF55) TaxID=988480 RepID=A0A075AY17_ROZAC|nr:Zinc finger, PHD-type domain-containing protein [Rozella allomycis CSF55]|eukprot:EPZ33469.1 Zinc finger, PHD-type domain-containing protein [Rozella allomycis CSF55]
MVDFDALITQEAFQTYPFRIDKCSYSQGYVLQRVYRCLTCNPAAEGEIPRVTCYACSISCHAEHEIEELWLKRSIRCDCCTVGNTSQCFLENEKYPVNEKQPYLDKNSKDYHNYFGKFCFCDSSYDPEKETREMLQCISCFDWFHDSCIEQNIDLESFDSFICRNCVPNFQPFLEHLIGLEANHPCTFNSNGDCYLQEEWRSKVCRCPNCLTFEREFPFLFSEETPYDPPEDVILTPAENLMDGVFNKILTDHQNDISSLPQPAIIDAIHEYNDLKTEFNAFCNNFKDKIISEQVSKHIQKFFEEFKAKKANKVN